MHVVKLMAPPFGPRHQTKDIDFSPSGIKRPLDAGYAEAKAALEREPWVGPFDPLADVIVHKPAGFDASAALNRPTVQNT